VNHPDNDMSATLSLTCSASMSDMASHHAFHDLLKLRDVRSSYADAPDCRRDERFHARFASQHAHTQPAYPSPESSSGNFFRYVIRSQFAATVNFNGGTKIVTVTSDTKVVTLVPGDRSELKPNAKIFIPAATRTPDGALEANRVTVGKDGIPPPM
jgi:hypothetical protein